MRVLLALLCMASCTPPAASPPETTTSEPSAFMDALPAFEDRLGGRLGLILIDGAGREILAHRSEARMAYCSSFKFALGAAALEAASEGVIDLKTPQRYDPAELPFHSPTLAEAGGVSDLRSAIEAVVTVSDNGAANMLIDALGGPQAVTARWRSWGDVTSRLDRRETVLNENAPGDPRDTSTAKAMVETIRRLDSEAILSTDDRDWLFELGERATTGLDRVRAGLPKGWAAGDKTGTCKGPGRPDQQVNDIGWIDRPNGRDRYYFAVMAQRPTVSVDETKSIMAELGAHMALAIGH